MRVTQVMVDLEKRVNDGNYGSEKATVQYVALVEDGEDPDAVIRELISRGRARVIGELSASESLSVRRALNPPQRVCPACGQPLADDDDYEHEACAGLRRGREEQVRQEQRARWAAEQAEREAAHALAAPSPAAVWDDEEENEDESAEERN